MPCTQYTAVRNLVNLPFPPGFMQALKAEGLTGVECNKTERGLLNYLITLMFRVDPDVLVGHNFLGFDLDVLLHRMKANKVDHWSRIGRLRRTQWPKLQHGVGGMGESTFAERSVTSGRLICDTYLAAKDLVRAKSYSLTNLAAEQLQINRSDIEYEKVAAAFEHAQQLARLLRHCAFDGFLTASLASKLQVLPLYKQLTNLAGNLWSRTLTGARAERNEYLLLHEFHRNKFIAPDKTIMKHPLKKTVEGAVDDEEHEEHVATSGKQKRKPAYAGGLVLEPKRGFYDSFVLLLDFNSLYPSIIQEFNICFTTVDRPQDPDEVPPVPDEALKAGILPRLIGTLVERRRNVKKLMKDPKATPAEIAQYDIRQKALKLTANSMYGCLGFTHSRFYAKPLAMLITSKGREILQNTVELAQNKGLDVIYGDTDSIMIHTATDDLDQVKKIGNDLKRDVNRRYKLLEIEMDGFFQRMLLLKKKKYAALMVDVGLDGKLHTTIETKGLDLVRRDWCGISHDVSNVVLAQILSGQGREVILEHIHQYLVRVGEDVRAGMVPLTKFVINKGLTKAPKEYADAKSQPHVQVAKRLLAKGIGARAGETIPYVICTVHGQNVAPFAERAYHPDDLKDASSGLAVDYEWYLNQQIHPPVSRLCEPIEGTDSYRIAQCLGLDPSKFRATVQAPAMDTQSFFKASAKDRFSDADPLRITCPNCGHAFDFAGFAYKQDTQYVSGYVCPSCTNLVSHASINTQLRMQIQHHIHAYSKGWLVCDEPSCRHSTRQLNVDGQRCLVTGCNGHVVYTYPATRLYTQLMYYRSLFDKESVLSTISTEHEKVQVTKFYVDVVQFSRNTVTRYLDKNARGFIDLSELFKSLRVE